MHGAPFVSRSFVTWVCVRLDDVHLFRMACVCAIRGGRQRASAACRRRVGSLRGTASGVHGGDAPPPQRHKACTWHLLRCNHVYLGDVHSNSETQHLHLASSVPQTYMSHFFSSPSAARVIAVINSSKWASIDVARILAPSLPLLHVHIRNLYPFLVAVAAAPRRNRHVGNAALRSVLLRNTPTFELPDFARPRTQGPCT